MKRDVDAIIYKRFGVSGAIDSYTLGTSRPIAAVPPGGAYPASNPPARRPAPITPLPSPAVQSPYQQGLYAPPAPRRRSNVGLNFLLLILVVVLLFAFGFGAYSYFQRRGTATTNTPTPVAASNIPANGIGVMRASNGESIGISNGLFTFDTRRTGGDLMNKAAQRFQSGDTSGAETLWSQAAQG